MAKPGIPMAVIGLGGHDEPDEDEDGSYEISDGEKLAIHEFAQAMGVHGEIDVKAACEAMRSLFKIFESQPHKEAGEEEPEEEGEMEGGE